MSFAFENYMLGDMIYEGRGTTIGRRVLGIDMNGGPSMEISMSGKGPIKGNIECTDIWTYWTVAGQRGQGRGIIMVNDGSNEVVTAVSQGIGNLSDSRSMRYVGANFYSTASTGKLAFMNNSVGMFEAVIDTSSNYTVKVWEWK
jgi:hypothetical protein